MAAETVVANKANNTSVAEANEANEVNKACEAEAVDEAQVDLADDATEANVIDEIDATNEVNVAEEANVIDKIVVSIKADEAILAKANKSLANGGIAVIVKYRVSCCATISSSFALTCCLNSPSQNILYLLLK